MTHRAYRSDPHDVARRLFYGQRIRDLREAAGLDQGRLGAAIGRDRTYIGRIERGRTSLTVEMAERILAALGRAPTDLYTSAA